MNRVLVGALVCAAAIAQDDSGGRLSVAFSDPSRPGQVKASLVNGSITVRGYDGKDVRIGNRGENGRRRPGRLILNGADMQIEESGNVLTIASPSASAELVLEVPRRTSLKLNCVNGGGITVEGVSGEIEAHNTNGSVTLKNISGSAVAHALNGRLTAVFDSVDPSKAMSFSSLNGRIDLTFPATLKATLKLDPGQGEVHTDFDITLQPASKAQVEDQRSSGGKYRARFNRGIVGTINGGGPEITVRNFNGAIYIRKAGAAQ